MALGDIWILGSDMDETDYVSFLPVVRSDRGPTPVSSSPVLLYSFPCQAGFPRKPEIKSSGNTYKIHF